jgi:hypothetical protein
VRVKPTACQVDGDEYQKEDERDNPKYLDPAWSALVS